MVPRKGEEIFEREERHTYYCADRVEQQMFERWGSKNIEGKVDKDGMESKRAGRWGLEARFIPQNFKNEVILGG